MDRKKERKNGRNASTIFAINCFQLEENDLETALRWDRYCTSVVDPSGLNLSEILWNCSRLYLGWNQCDDSNGSLRPCRNSSGSAPMFDSLTEG